MNLEDRRVITLGREYSLEGIMREVSGSFLDLWLYTGVCSVCEKSVGCIFMICILFCLYFKMLYIVLHISLCYINAYCIPAKSL